MNGEAKVQNVIQNIGVVLNLADVKLKVPKLNTADFHLHNRFAKFFNAYAQAINKMYFRTGSLLESPFRRNPIKEDVYLTRIIGCIHWNPRHHRKKDDFKIYPRSSYKSHLSNAPKLLNRIEVLGGLEVKRCIRLSIT